MQKDMVLDLGVICYKVLRGWKLMILAGILLAGLWTVKDFKDSKNATTVVLDPVQRQESMAAAMSKDSLEEVETLYVQKYNLDQLKAYMENSVFMMSDPFAVNTVHQDFYIKDTTNASKVAEAYISYIENGALCEEVMKSYTKVEDEMYLQELICVENPQAEDDVTDVTVVSTSDEMALFTVKVIGLDELQSQEIAKVVEGALKAYQPQIAKNTQGHSLVAGDAVSSVMVDETMIAAQNQKLSHLNSQNTIYKQAYSKMSGDQIALLNLMLENAKNKDVVVTEEITTVAAVQTSFLQWKHIIVGFMAGIILVAGCIGVWDVFTQKVICARQLNHLTKCFGIYGKKKEKWLSLLFLGEASESEEEQLQRMIAKISVYCEKKQADTIYLVSNKLSEKGKGKFDRISEELKKNRIQNVSIDGVFQNAEAIKSLGFGKDVVIVQETGVATVRNIEEFCEALAETDSQIAGVLLVQN